MPDNKPRWTPGPWANDLPWAVTQNGRVILTTAIDVPTTGEAEAIANVTLASAAPDLYAALESLVTEDMEWTGDIQDKFDAARAALLKANPQRTREVKDAG